MKFLLKTKDIFLVNKNGKLQLDNIKILQLEYQVIKVSIPWKFIQEA